jgi:hypothetical protein
MYSGFSKQMQESELYGHFISGSEPYGGVLLSWSMPKSFGNRVVQGEHFDKVSIYRRTYGSEGRCIEGHTMSSPFLAVAAKGDDAFRGGFSVSQASYVLTSIVEWVEPSLMVIRKMGSSIITCSSTTPSSSSNAASNRTTYNL